MLKKILPVVMALLAWPPLAHAAEDDDKLKAILGVNWTELQSCTRDEECAITTRFSDCCDWISINRKYQNDVQSRSDALMKAFMAPDRIRMCGMMDCAPGLTWPACQHNRCMLVQPEAGAFWKISGTILQGSAKLDPIFTLKDVGFKLQGVGNYSLEVQDAAGVPLFVRRFGPHNAQSGSREWNGPPVFSELVPVTEKASAIVLVSPEGKELDRITLGGKAPDVTITRPGEGFTPKGVQTIAWNVTGAKARASEIFYSTDDGANWQLIGTVHEENTFAVDFDKLARAAKARIRVLVSDGANTGSAVSPPFAVPELKVQVGISNPESGAVFDGTSPVYLDGHGFAMDVLPDSALKWTSDIQGDLGTGNKLQVKLKPGNHVITLTATDTQGNSNTTSVKVLIGGDAPEATVTVSPLNGPPTNCWAATVSASPGKNGGAPLSLVKYSLDHGKSWIEVPLEQLPYRFIVPGSGAFNVNVMVFDTAHRSGGMHSATSYILTPCPQATEGGAGAQGMLRPLR